MSENMQRVCVSILTVMVLMLSISKVTKGNNDHAPAPMSEKGLLPNPISCVADARKIPDCVEAIKQGHLKIIKKNVVSFYSVFPKIVLGFYFLYVSTIVSYLRLHAN
ncbi:hypothetical protein AtEden1_Chr3g0199661 [Arabidopsis thaliana]